MKHIGIALGLAAGAAVLSACGSTVQLGSVAPGTSNAGATTGLSDGLSLQPGTPIDSSPSDSPSASSEASTPTTGPPSDAPTSPAATDDPIDGGPSGSSSSVADLANGPGVSAAAINVGFIYASDAASSQAALGGSAPAATDQLSKAVVADINAHGGVAGRKLNLVLHALKTSDGSNDQLAAAACADLSQDHKVLVSAPLAYPSFVQCMSKAGSVTAGASTGDLPASHFATYPYYYDVSGLPTDEVATNLAAYLVRSGYFSKWDAHKGAAGSSPVKVGIIAPDTPGWVGVTPKVLVPALAKLGIKVGAGDVRIWNFPTDSASQAGSVAQIQGMILRMRSDGVTHVIPTELNSLAFFATGAEAQGYRPRYGINSADVPESQLGGLIPYDQMNGAMGIGFEPGSDLPPGYNKTDGPYAGKNKTHCLSVMSKAGITFSTATQQATAYLACDFYYSVQATLNAIPKGSAITKQTFMKALEGLGSSFKSAALPTATYGPGHHYPVTVGYDFRYYADCKCTHYNGAPFTLK